MQNHEILQRIHAALALDDDALDGLVQLAGLSERAPSPAGLLLPPDHEDHLPCDDAMVVALLDALIVQRRGPGRGQAPPPQQLNNNLVLKKLRIALGYEDADMLAIFARAGMQLSRNQLGALFRAPTNKHFKACSDGQLLCFLTGLKRARD